MNSVEVNNQVYHYIIERKPIKHLYIRLKENYFLVTCSAKHSTLVVENFLKDNIEKLLLKKEKKKIVKTPQYMLNDKQYTKEEFYALYNYPNDDRYYFLVLRTHLEQRVQNLNIKIAQILKILQLKPVVITYKKLISRYGACHIKDKYITLSLFMAKLNDQYLEYVIAHEYCHFLVPNHSPQFYAKLSLIDPNHQQIQKKLRKIPISF